MRVEASSALRADDPASARGVELRRLSKSFAAPGGFVHAVRGVDIDVAAGETVALLGPNGAGKSTTIDMLLGLQAPDAGTVSVFGRSPDAAIAAGAVGAMLQTGGLLRDLSVRELVEMMGSLYPSAARRRRRARADRHARRRRPAHAEAVRRRDPARALRDRARLRPGAARARRAHRRDGRRGTP